MEVKGESGHYFLLVQGSEGGGCKARMIHSANQINGAAAMATVNGLLKENSVSSSGKKRLKKIKEMVNKQRSTLI